MSLAPVLAATLLLSSCAIVVVRPEGGKPTVGAYPLGVQIGRGSAEAIGVKQWSIGLWRTCYAAGVGISKSTCVVADARSCGVFAFDGPSQPTLTKIADQTRHACQHSKEPSP